MPQPPDLLDLESALLHRVVKALELLRELEQARGEQYQAGDHEARARHAELLLKIEDFTSTSNLITAQVLRHQIALRKPGLIRRFWRWLW